MARDYIQRRNPPVGRSDRPRNNKMTRKPVGPPPFLILSLILIVVLVLAVLIWSLVKHAGKNKDDRLPPDVSSQVVSSDVEPGPEESEPVVSEPVSSAPPAATPPPEKIPSGDPEKLDVHFKIGDTGYEYYNFVTDYANRYITTVANGADQLSGATLYDIVVPTSMDVMLPEDYINKQEINSSDQRKAIEDYIYPSITGINPKVKTVSIFDALKLHNNEYIYFRTDHHWTQLGAYYAYVEFCKAKGIQAVPLESFRKDSYEGFLGSFYDASPNTDMSNNPDTVEAYRSDANTSLTYVDNQGNTIEGWPVIQDGDAYDTANLYYIFCAADQPYEVITNHDLDDGSACVVVKESFGNVFIPFLTNHYEHVYVVDYRYYTGDISDLAAEKGAQDVILVNNISMTRNEDLIDDLENTF